MKINSVTPELLNWKSVLYMSLQQSKSNNHRTFSLEQNISLFQVKNMNSIYFFK